MLLTEEEAKTKWCPFVRVMNISGQGGGNRWDGSGAPADSPNGSLCIGSECMAWRAMPERTRLFVAVPGRPEEEYAWDPRDTRDPMVREHYAAAAYREDIERLGFCGLSGKP